MIIFCSNRRWVLNSTATCVNWCFLNHPYMISSTLAITKIYLPSMLLTILLCQMTHRWQDMCPLACVSRATTFMKKERWKHPPIRYMLKGNVICKKESKILNVGCKHYTIARRYHLFTLWKTVANSCLKTSVYLWTDGLIVVSRATYTTRKIESHKSNPNRVEA